MPLFGLITITGRLVRAARALAGITQRELAHKAHIAPGTVKRIEAQSGPVQAQTDTVRKLVTALNRMGIEFTDAEHPGVRQYPLQRRVRF